jgi:hypothetical protein
MEILDTPSGSNDSKRPMQDLLDNGYGFSIGDAISEGYDLFRVKMGEFIGYTVVVILISLAASFIPFASVVIGAPLTAGFFIMAHRIKTNGDTDFGVFFKGFDHFVQLILYSIVASILIAIGVVLLILPGIYLAIAYSLAIFFVIFYKMEFWDAMEWSRKVVTKRWWKVFLLIIVLAFINIGGMLAFGIGVLFTIPLSQCALYSAYRQIVKGADVSDSAPDPSAEEVY